jgi:hypothetical protein
VTYFAGSIAVLAVAMFFGAMRPPRGIGMPERIEQWRKVRAIEIKTPSRRVDREPADGVLQKAERVAAYRKLEGKK